MLQTDSRPSKTFASNALPSWQMQEAKNRLSAVVRAANQSAQLVTVHGQVAAVVISPKEYEQLRRGQSAVQPLSARLACPILDEKQVKALFKRDHKINPSRELALDVAQSKR